MTYVTPQKRIRAESKMKLIYLLREEEKNGWHRGAIFKEYDDASFQWVSYMTKER